MDKQQFAAELKAFATQFDKLFAEYEADNPDWARIALGCTLEMSCSNLRNRIEDPQDEFSSWEQPSAVFRGWPVRLGDDMEPLLYTVTSSELLDPSRRANALLMHLFWIRVYLTLASVTNGTRVIMQDGRSTVQLDRRHKFRLESGHLDPVERRSLIRELTKPALLTVDFEVLEPANEDTAKAVPVHFAVEILPLWIRKGDNRASFPMRASLGSSGHGLRHLSTETQEKLWRTCTEIIEDRTPREDISCLGRMAGRVRRGFFDHVEGRFKEVVYIEPEYVDAAEAHVDYIKEHRKLGVTVTPWYAKVLSPKTAILPVALPPGTRWEDITITFFNRDQVRVSVKGTDVDFNSDFKQMGFASERYGTPTKQWELLYLLAKIGGKLDWSYPEAKSILKKRKSLLAKGLKEVFPSLKKTDPFYDYKAYGAYKIKLTLIPD